MTINLALGHGPGPRITVVGVGGAGGNAIDNMVAARLEGVEFVACNTDAQALAACRAEHRVQLGATYNRTTSVPKIAIHSPGCAPSIVSMCSGASRSR